MSNFTSPKYQAVIRTVNTLLSQDDCVATLRKRFMAVHKVDPCCGGTLPMSGACVSTYFANVTEHLRAAKTTSSTIVQVVGKTTVMSICKVNEYGIVTEVTYYEDDSYLDVDTKGLMMTKGYQIVGEKLGVVANVKPEVKVVQLDASMWVNA